LLSKLDTIRKPIPEMVKKHVWKNFKSKEIVLKYDDLFTSILIMKKNRTAVNFSAQIFYSKQI